MELAAQLYVYPWTDPRVNNCNTYLLVPGGVPVMIDPGHAQLFKHVEAGMRADRIDYFPEMVIVTHCHPDHLEAALVLQRQGAKLAMHPMEVAYLEGEGRQLAAALGLNLDEVVVDAFLEEGELVVGGESLEVLHTPGHGPGHICIYWPRHKALISGDLVFVQGVGRVDFPGGDGTKLKESIRKVARLDIEWLMPGHGPLLKGAANVARNFQLIEQTYFPLL